MPFSSLAVPALAFALAFSGPPAVSAQADLNVDVGTFAYGPDETLLEAYISIGAASLAYQADGAGFGADVPLRIELFPVASGAPAGAASAPVLTRNVALRFVVPDTTRLLSSQVFIEQVRAAVAPGDYTLRLTANADTEQPEVRLDRDVVVPDYDGLADGVGMSSLQVASRIERATEAGDPFVKSGLLVQPNPDVRYGGARSAVPYYVEVYLPRVEGTYTFLTYVAASDTPTPIPATQARFERPARPVDVIAGQVDISTLPTGIYFLRAAVLDAGNEALGETSKKIYVINPDVARPELAAAELDYESTTFGLMGDEELERAVEQALILASQQERNAIRTLETNEQRRTFLSRFWRDRDADPNAYTNLAHREHLARVAAIAERFRESAGRRGVQTDRGMTFVKFGPPTEIERRTTDSDRAPYEIWTYDNIVGAGRGLFVFADRFKSNTYDLIHSNVPGETSLPDWESELLLR